MTRNHEPIVSEAKSGLARLKLEVANETLGRDMNQQISSSNYEKTLDEKKWEVADDLGLKNKIANAGWENMTTKEVGQIGGRMGGKIGGNMVKKMIVMAESQMAPVDKEVQTASRHELEKKT